MRQSDIEIIVEFNDEDGNKISVPEYDWEMSFYTSRNRITVAQVDGVMPDCASVDDDGKLHLCLDSPQLGYGDVWRECVLHIPDDNFPDGIRTSVSNKRIGTIKLCEI